MLKYWGQNRTKKQDVSGSPGQYGAKEIKGNIITYNCHTYSHEMSLTSTWVGLPFVS